MDGMLTWATKPTSWIASRWTSERNRGLFLAVLTSLTGLTAPHSTPGCRSGDLQSFLHERSTGIDPGFRMQRILHSGETHTYTIYLQAGQSLEATADQMGIDVEVILKGAGGRQIARIDSPNGANGPEQIELEAIEAGTYGIEIAAQDKHAVPGRYELRVDNILTAEELAERRARQTYKSPRLLRLWHELRVHGAAAMDLFWREMGKGADNRADSWRCEERADHLPLAQRQGHAPGSTGRGPPTGGPWTPMERMEGQDLWYATLPVPKDARFCYSFYINGPALPPLGLDARQIKYEFRPDPVNPRMVNGESLVELPDAPRQPFLERTVGVAAGTMREAVIVSGILKRRGSSKSTYRPGTQGTVRPVRC